MIFIIEIKIYINISLRFLEVKLLLDVSNLIEIKKYFCSEILQLPRNARYLNPLKAPSFQSKN